MTIRRYILLLMLLTLPALLSGCADAEDEEIKFKVISYGGSFAGWYSIDSGIDVPFTETSVSNNVYSHEQKVDLKDQIEIEASPLIAAGEDGAPTSLEIKVYRDGSLVKSVQDSDSSVSTVNLIYTSGEISEEN